MKKETFIIIRTSAILELGLKGLDLLIYSIIDGICQHTGNKFQGSQGYLSEVTGYSRQSVAKSLKKLTDKGFLLKEDRVINNVKFCDYTTSSHSLANGGKKTHRSSTKFTEGCKESLQGSSTKFTEGCQQSLHHNIIDNIYDNIIDNIEADSKISKKQTLESPEEKEKSSAKKEKEDFQEWQDFYNACIDKNNSGMSRSLRLSGQRLGYLKARLKEFGDVHVRKVIEDATKSDFLGGSTGFKADFEWIMRPENFLKILEGRYANKKSYGNNQQGRIGEGYDVTATSPDEYNCSF